MNLTRSSVVISPSIAAGDLLALRDEIARLEAGGADAIHFDGMDGHFVPFLTWGVPFVEQIKMATKLPLDVHIMVTNTDQVFEDYLKAGADSLTFHIETSLHANRICQKIHEYGKRAGIALNPSTHWTAIEYLLPYVDMVTVMTVNPGFSRQAHLSQIQQKIEDLAAAIARAECAVQIQVDGGVGIHNIAHLYHIGARNFVAGGAVMGKPDYGVAIGALRAAAVVPS